MIKIKLIKSSIGIHPKAKRTIKALGLNRMFKERMVDETNLALKGMVDRVSRYLKIEKVD